MLELGQTRLSAIDIGACAKKMILTSGRVNVKVRMRVRYTYGGDLRRESIRESF